MKLDFAFLADAANMTANGLFDVISGGFDVVTGKAFPATKPAVVLIGRIVCDLEECDKEHTFVGEILDQEGKPIFPALGGSFTASRHPRRAGRAIFQSVCLNYQGVTFPAPGDYFFRLSVDGKPIGHVMVEAVLEMEPT